MTIVENARQFAATATANGILLAGKHNPVDASGGARTMTLPFATSIGANLSVEKRDSSTNVVTVSGNIRGGSTPITLAWQFESVTFRWDGTTWVPTEGHKTKSSMDAAYNLPSIVTAATVGSSSAVPVITYDAKGRITSTTSVAISGGSGGGFAGNVKTFGAVGNGTTDDTAAIQAVINAGLPVYFPAGTYKVTSTLTYAKGARFFGDGLVTTKIKYAGASGTFLFAHQFNPADSPHQGSTQYPGRVAFDDLTLQGDGSNSVAGSNATVNGISCSAASGDIVDIPFYSLRRCLVTDFNTAVQLEGYGHHFEEVHARHSQVGIDLTHPEQAMLLNCWTEFCDVGLQVNVRRTAFFYGQNFQVIAGAYQRCRIGIKLRNFYEVRIDTYFELNSEKDIEIGDPTDPTNYTKSIKNSIIGSSFSGSNPSIASIDAYALAYAKINFMNTGGQVVSTPHIKFNGYCKNVEIEYGESSITSTNTTPFSFGGDAALTCWAHPMSGTESVIPTLNTITGVTASTTSPLRYYKTKADQVAFEGKIIIDGTYTSGITLFTLPYGYRPLYTRTYAIRYDQAGTWATGTLQIDTGGVVTVQNGMAASRNLYFDGIFFRSGMTAY